MEKSRGRQWKRGLESDQREPGTVVRSDGLSCFRGVTDAGCEHEPRVTGDGKGSCETPGLTWVNMLLGNVKRAYRFNRCYELAALVPHLGNVAARTPPLPHHLLTLAGTAGY